MPGKHPNPPAEPAKQQGDQLLLTPELSLCSYPPEDLLLRDGLYQACAQALAELVHKTSRVSLWWSDTHMNCM